MRLYSELRIISVGFHIGALKISGDIWQNICVAQQQRIGGTRRA